MYANRTAPRSDAEAVHQSMAMAMEMDDAAAFADGDDAPLVVSDNENISQDGWWRQCLFVRNGRRVPANWRQQQQQGSGTSTSTSTGSTSARHWPVATSLFERLLAAPDDHGSASSSSSSAGVSPDLWAAAAGVSERLPKGSIEYSMLGPGAHLKKHCGPSNHRLRIHLPIILPTTTQENERVRMIIAGFGGPPGDAETVTVTGSEAPAPATAGPKGVVVGGTSISRPWVAGKASIFDDSYEVCHTPLLSHYSTPLHSATPELGVMPALLSGFSLVALCLLGTRLRCCCCLHTYICMIVA